MIKEVDGLNVNIKRHINITKINIYCYILIAISFIGFNASELYFYKTAFAGMILGYLSILIFTFAYAVFEHLHYWFFYERKMIDVKGRKVCLVN